jgi:septum formation protein
MVQGEAKPLILASGSPRRRQVLTELGLPFVVIPASSDGPSLATDPAKRVLDHARFKAQEVHQDHPEDWVLGADTMVFCQGIALGKAADVTEARQMIARLVAAGNHEVWTGAALLGPNGQVHSRADVARVSFREPPAAALDQYLAGEEWYDKAGAYAIQGWAGSFATLEQGWRGTVVGLAKEAVLGLYEAAGLPMPASGR